MKFIDKLEQDSNISPVFDLAHFLQAELSARQSKNKSYSLRSFARDIDISPAHLSQILSRQRVPSDLMVEKCLQVLDLSNESKAIISAIDIRTKESRNEIIIDEFKEITKWCEIALISTIQTFPGINFEDILTENLGTKEEVEAALRKLENHEIIYTERDHYYPVQKTKSMYKSIISDEDKIAIIESMSENVMERIYDNFNMLLLVNKKDVGYAAMKIEQFYINLTQELAKRRKESQDGELAYLTAMGLVGMQESNLSNRTLS